MAEDESFLNAKDLVIDNGTGTNNWAWAETQDWCSGSGTVEDPYTISDYFIDGKSAVPRVIAISVNCSFIRLL